MRLYYQFDNIHTVLMADVKASDGFRDKRNDDNQVEECDADADKVVYLLSPDSPLYLDRSSYRVTEENLVEPSHPHVTHKHSLFEVLNNDLLQQMVNTVIKANYFWTRIGLEQEQAQEKIELLQEKLAEVIEDFAEDEKAEYRVYCRQIRQLKMRIEAVLTDLETLVSEAELRQLIQSCEQQVRPSGTKYIDSCLLVQRTCLFRQYQTLQACRDKHLQQFLELKDELKSILQWLGLKKLADAQCASILEKRVANYEEMSLLQKCTDAYRAQLEQRRAYCQEVSRKVCFISRLVPHQIDESFLFIEDNSQQHCLVFSEENQLKLEQLHEFVLQSALATWQQLYEAYERLGKLYRLFEVTTDHRHPCFNIVDQITADNRAVSQDNGIQNLPRLDLFQEHNVTLEEALDEIQAEQKHYEGLKSERLAELIGTTRRRFADLLARCLVSLDSLRQDERFSFLFVTDNFDDALLGRHEAEMDRLRDYHRKYETIFSLVNKWRELKGQLFACEQEMQSGNNYRNRGGILQKLLTKQRVTKKQLAQITNQLGAWLHKNNTSSAPTDSLPFDLYTLTVEDIAHEVGPQPPPPAVSARSPVISTPMSSCGSMNTPLYSKKNPQAKMKLSFASVSSRGKYAGNSSGRFARFH